MTEQVPVDELFEEALRLTPGAERSAFLGAACAADAKKRKRIERLLAAHAEANSFLESPAADPLSAAANLATEQPGTMIGPHRLVEQIGEGGFGVVYLAEQERPVRRKVALKVIKPGMDTPEVIGRFEAERQALAMMDHPGIAKVFDAGTTDGGRPFFVMELVQGVPITEYCDQCNLSTRERLDLFVSVCRAVQHAHQKGIIHRDIKPTNVLVAMQDGRPTPKVIDFGVAKAIGHRLTEHTLTTGFAQMVGTPLYMSPEQAELSPLGVDTRSDIYSLGVLLYELLTGATPFDRDRLRVAAYDEVRRIIREEEPPRPSARISTFAADAATTIAEHRRTDARRLVQTVRGELDWILMKCLEKDRSRRYESASSLARDVERHLSDEPVQACPPSSAYRFRKFARRNKTLLATSATIAAALVVGLGLSTWMYVRERAAVEVSKANEQRATEESKRAQAISALLQEMLASANPDRIKGAQYTLRELLDAFSAGLGDQLDGQPVVEAAIRSVIGNAYWRLGVYDRAETNLKKALDLRRQEYGANDERVAENLVDYAWNLAEQGRPEEAERLTRDALAIYRKHGADARFQIRALWSMQQFLMRQSRLAEAEKVAHDALDLAGDLKTTDYAEVPNILHALAESKWTDGKPEEAETLARRAVETHRRVQSNHHPETAWGLYNLGRALKAQQKFPEAKKALEEALDIFRKYYTQDHHSIQSVRGDLKSILETEGDDAGLEALADEEAEDIDRTDSPEKHVRLARLLLSDNAKDKTDEARRLMHRVIEAYDAEVIESADDLIRRVHAIGAYAILIGDCGAAPSLAGEVKELNRRLDVELPKLLAAFPDSSECQWQTAMIYRDWAFESMQHSALLPTAEHALGKAARILELVAVDHPKRPGLWLYLADTYTHLGDTQWRLAERDGAAASFRRAMDVMEEHTAEIEAHASLADTFGFALDYIRLAYFLVCLGEREEAAEFVVKTTLAAERLQDSAYASDILYFQALAKLRIGDETGYRDACAAMLAVPAINVDENFRFRRIAIWCLAPQPSEDLSAPLKEAEGFAAINSLGAPYLDLACLGGVLFRAGRLEEAARHLTESIATYPGNPPIGRSTDVVPKMFLSMTHWKEGRHDEARRLLAETQPDIDKWLESPSCPWYGRAMVEVLRREAEDMIGPHQPDTPPASDQSNGALPQSTENGLLTIAPTGPISTRSAMD